MWILVYRLGPKIFYFFKDFHAMILLGIQLLISRNLVCLLGMSLVYWHMKKGRGRWLTSLINILKSIKFYIRYLSKIIVWDKKLEREYLLNPHYISKFPKKKIEHWFLVLWYSQEVLWVWYSKAWLWVLKPSLGIATTLDDL